jgi:K+-sensing histidine kinase KdpD
VDESSRTAVGIGLGSLGAIVVAGALVGVRDQLGPTNAALILLLFVLLAAIIGGRRAGAVVAVVAGISFDFFHTKPYGSFTISDGQEIITMVLLMAVGMAIGEIAIRADRIRDTTYRRDTGVRRIHTIASIAAAGHSSEEVIAAVCRELTAVLRLDRCWFEPAPYEGELPAIQPSGSIDTNEYHYTPTGFELPAGGAELVVRSGDDVIGRFVLMPRVGVGTALDDRLVAVALADQVSVVLGRAG